MRSALSRISRGTGAHDRSGQSADEIALANLVYNMMRKECPIPPPYWHRQMEGEGGALLEIGVGMHPG